MVLFLAHSQILLYIFKTIWHRDSEVGLLIPICIRGN